MYRACCPWNMSITNDWAECILGQGGCKNVTLRAVAEATTWRNSKNRGARFDEAWLTAGDLRRLAHETPRRPCWTNESRPRGTIGGAP